MKYGCIGEHLSHSFSKEIHGKLADYEYSLREIPRGELAAFMKEKAFLAINVTIPYKEEVIPFLNEISDRAREIGAVNTVVNRGGRLFGDNTDFYGMSRLIGKLGVPLAGLDVLILGTGGTSRTACSVAKALGAAAVTRVSRSGKDGCITYAEAYETHADAGFIINTTPCGMFPKPDACPVDVGRFTSLRGAADAVYNPLRTLLVSRCRARGIPAEGGLYMLAAQAVRAVEIFLDKPFDHDPLPAVFNEIRREKENIVLTGMPGCGKTTIGRALASLLSRKFYDLDEEIARFAGCSVPEIFASRGETGFRDLEEQVLKSVLAPKTGCVIATGGGAVLRDANVLWLKQNGRCCFLDRPLSELLPTPDRPTASTPEAIRQRYAERYDRYLSTCDVKIPVSGGELATAKRIAEEFNS